MRRIFVLMIVFLAGWLACSVTGFISDNIQNPFSSYNVSPEINSPHDWVGQDNIHVYNDRVVIDIQDPDWATFTDTNSMDPIFDEVANTIEIKPQSPADIHVGDIIAYESALFDSIIIHRVVEINEDDEGWYARFKGDNNQYTDPEKVRFDQIKGIVVAIIY